MSVVPTSPTDPSERVIKCTNGNQYQKWVKINIPTQAPNLGTPDSDASYIMEFLPPVSKRPAAIIAPYLAKISSCFFV